MALDGNTTFVLRLYGPFAAFWDNGGGELDEITVRSRKMRGLLALLATSPDQKRTRSFLQDMFWGRAGQAHGRLSLRGDLTRFREDLGPDHEAILRTSNDEVALTKGRVRVIGSPADGDFLEGLDIQEDRFEDWLRDQRHALAQTPEDAPRVPAMVGPAVSRHPRAVAPLQEPSLNPCFAILPLAAAPGDRDGQAMGDLISEEIARAISRTPLIDVISHLSCRGLDAEAVSITDIGKTLRADYVVVGRVRRRGTGFAAVMEFIDISTCQIRWTREIEGEAETLFNEPEAVLSQICADIGRAIIDSSVKASSMRPLGDVESHQLLISAVAMMHRQNLSSFSRARSWLLELITRMPRHAIPQAWLGKWFVLSVQQGWSIDFAKDGQSARDWSQKALDIDPDNSFCLTINGFVNNNLLKRFDTADERFDEATALDPNNALAWLLKGTLMAFMDQGEAGAKLTARARRLSPLDPQRYFFESLSATAHLSAGDYHEALRLAESSLRLNRRHTSTLRVRTIALHELGEHAKAAQAAKDLRRLEPSLTVERYLQNHPAAEFETGRIWANALKNSGIPMR